MECPYEDEALKFVHKISPVILDAFICFENDRKPAKLKDNRSKIKSYIILCWKEHMHVLEHFSDLASKETLR